MKFSATTEREEFSVAFTADLHQTLIKHLLRSDEQEDVAFALYKPSVGTLRFTAVIYRVILPEDGDREVHGNATINSRFFRRVCQLAVQEESGVVLLHSHLGPGWQGMSEDDFATERGYSEPGQGLTDLPFVGLTLGTDESWSARLWEYANGWHEQRSASTVRVIGKSLRVSYDDRLRPRPRFKEVYKRTVTVWGEHNHAHLARMRIGIVGLGSVGSIVAETLARMGIERFLLMDFDEVQEHNLDRLLGATRLDIGHHKAVIAQRQILKAATASNPQIRVVLAGITEEEGYRNALDCDLLFSCVDRPWPRQVLNHLAYNHLIPVVDGGIGVRLNPDSGAFEGAEWQAQSVGPERPCLQCLRLYDPATVGTERAGLLDDPSYLAGLPADHAFKRNENIFPFSANLASLEVLQFVEQVTGIGGVHCYGTQRYMYEHGAIRLEAERCCQPGCEYAAKVASADSVYPAPTGFDHSAAAARKRQTGAVGEPSRLAE
jgi:molybdopterin-synthase adenylyltransferase